MKTTTTTVLILLLTLLMGACGSRPEIFKVDPAYAKYIAAYPAGMHSRRSGIRVELNEETLKKDVIQDSNVLKDIFTFEPEIEGQAVWIGERVIEFIPEEDLPSNQFYTVSFDLKKVANVDYGHEEFRFQFSTYTQKIYAEVYGLESYDNGDLNYFRLSGRISTTDSEKEEELKKVLKVVHDGKVLPVTLTIGDGENEYFFHADSIERKEQVGMVSVSWDGSVINSFSRGKVELPVTAKGDFQLNEAKVVDREDQSVELYFSEPIAGDQDLTGLISLKDNDPFTYSVDGNKVTLYLSKRIEGNRLLKVNAGIRNISGHKMRQSFERYLRFEGPKPLVRIKGEGSILPNSQGLIFPFESISLRSVDVRVVRIFEKNVHHFLQVNELDGGDELTRFGKVIAKKKIRLDKDRAFNSRQWSKHVIDLGKLISPEPGAIYRVSLKFSREDAVCDCDSSEISSNRTETVEIKDDWNEDLWHSWGFEDGFDSWYDYYDEYSACSDSYYYGKAISRNILASDLGMIFKLDEDHTSHAFINDMLTTDPVAKANVEYYTYAGEMIASGTTDQNGMLQIALKDKPFLMVAKRGKQRGYLKLRDGNVNSLSKFDIEGETSNTGIKGFIYGERGVWRPGDSLYISFMLGDKYDKLPNDHPVRFQLQDPMGQVVYEVTKTKNVEGIYDFRTRTEHSAVTGNYLAVAQVGNQNFYRTLKIETIKPNRLKIDFRVDPDHSDSAAYLAARWLHGTPAKKLKATVNVTLQPTRTVIQGWKGYEFDSPLRQFSADAVTVFDGTLNEKGIARPPARSHADTGAPGKLKATYVVKVFEESGDFSIDRFQTIYSPYSTYVGLRTPEMKGYDQTLITGTDHRFDVVTVNGEGKAVNSDRIQVRIYKLKWRWWYERDEEDLSAFISRSGTFAVKDTVISTVSGKASFRFKVRDEDYGRYLITVTDQNGEHQTGKIISFDWPYWNRGNRTENEQAKMLTFSCDKNAYVKGEKIKLSFPSPESGRALVSIENGSKVLQKFWIRTTKGETVHELTATAEMAPAAYVHVTMIQPHSQTRNDLPIRMYGVVPITVDDPTTHLEPEIAMAEVIRPESTASITVKEKNGKRMAYTLAIVDEGILDLTRFSTPQPWNTFYAREALGVKTWDMYDAVIGAYSGRLDDLISIGGDGSEDPGTGPKANRFKPMVRFMGPFILEANASKTHKINVPNYIGSVRVMVVAHDNDRAYGNAEKTAAVRKPLMLLTTLPRVLGPGEEVTVPVTVFATEKQVKRVSLGITSNDLVEVVGESAKTIEFTETGDQVVNFKIRVKKVAGIAKLVVKAQSGSEHAHEELEVDVRPANPEISKVDQYTLGKGGSKSQTIDFFGLQGTNKVTVELSTVPSMGLEKRLNYLITYPHGCVEQTTSGAFPQLFLSNLMDLNPEQKKSITNNVSAAIKRLQSFQTSSGGFSYWPGEGNENEWATNYAGHFLIEAQDAGYNVPGHVINRWTDYQQVRARNWTPGAYGGRSQSDELVQAYRLYLLALIKKPEIGAMNRLREKEGLSTAAKWRLAAAYKLAGQQDAARKLTSRLAVEVEDYRELSGTFGSAFRDQSMILEVLSLMGDDTRAEEVARDLAEKMRSEQWLSTQETAYALLAMCNYSGNKRGNAGVNCTVQGGSGSAKTVTSLKPVVKVTYRPGDLKGNSAVKVMNKGAGKLFVSFITTGVPEIGDKTPRSNGIQLSVNYDLINHSPLKPESILQGTEFEVEVVVRNTSTKYHLRELALTQIFPSGWEVHNTRMDEAGYSSQARYQDFRDDRVYSYFDLAPGETKRIRVKLNATYSGRFYLPGIYIEAMYDKSLSAYLPGKWVEVNR